MPPVGFKVKDRNPVTESMEGALDLSAKPHDTHNGYPSRDSQGHHMVSHPAMTRYTPSPETHREYSTPEIKKECPTPTHQTSDTESYEDQDSVSQDDSLVEKDRHSSSADEETSNTSPNNSTPGMERLPVSTDNGGTTPTSSRPFKMYPYDTAALGGMFPTPTSPMGTPMSGMLPYGASLGGPIGFSPMDISGMAMNSPLTNYLYQRKRKNEQRDNSIESKLSPTGAADDMPSLSPSIQPPAKKSNTVGIPEDKKDAAYWERRRKNNDAAKRSRDARRAKEEEIAFRAALLEQENLKLKAQVAILKSETQKLHMLLYQRM